MYLLDLNGSSMTCGVAGWLGSGYHDSSNRHRNCRLSTSLPDSVPTPRRLHLYRALITTKQIHNDVDHALLDNSRRETGVQFCLNVCRAGGGGQSAAVPDLAEHSLDVTASTVSEATPNALNLHRARRLAVTQWTEKYILPDRSVRTWTSAAFRPGLRTVLFAMNSW